MVSPRTINEIDHFAHSAHARRHVSTHRPGHQPAPARRHPRAGLGTRQPALHQGRQEGRDGRPRAGEGEGTCLAPHAVRVLPRERGAGPARAAGQDGIRLRAEGRPDRRRRSRRAERQGCTGGRRPAHRQIVAPARRRDHGDARGDGGAGQAPRRTRRFGPGHRCQGQADRPQTADPDRQRSHAAARRSRLRHLRLDRRSL